MWLGVLPIGLGAWVPLVAGYRARRRSWMLGGAGIIAFTIFAFGFASAEESNDFGGGLLTLAWLVVRHAFAGYPSAR